VQSAINGNSQLSGEQVTAAVNGSGHLVLTSQHYGTTSQVAIGSGNALASLGFTGNETGSGQDVAGSFVVNGVTEAATGKGQILTGNSTNANTAGLIVSSSLTPGQITGTPEATLTVTQGVAAHVGNVLSAMLDPVSGQLTTIQQSLQKQASNIGDSITSLQKALNLQQAQLLQQFVQMESNLAAIQGIANSLGSSLTGFASSGSSSSGSNSVLG
jgi:flagellar hook-associated protein 2